MADTVVTPEHVTFGGGVIRFILPAWAEYIGGRPTHCRSCDAAVLFVKSRRTGKLAPLDPDGISHFATCPQAGAWRGGAGQAPVTRARVEPTPAARLSRLQRSPDGSDL